jgi:hypothetical protein
MWHNLLPLFLNDVKLNCSILRLKDVYVLLGENAIAPYDSISSWQSSIRGILPSCLSFLLSREMIYFVSVFVNCTMISYRLFTQHRSPRRWFVITG